MIHIDITCMLLQPFVPKVPKITPIYLALIECLIVKEKHVIRSITGVNG